MKAIYGALLALIVSGTAQAAPVYDVCQKQVENYVTSQLGTTVTDITYEWLDSRMHRSRAWVKTPLCDGAFVFEIRGSYNDCHGPHYGRIPNYISSVWKYGACKNHTFSTTAEADIEVDAVTTTEVAAHPIPRCPAGTWPVAQYDWRGNFKGYQCEKYNDR